MIINTSQIDDEIMTEKVRVQIEFFNKTKNPQRLLRAYFVLSYLVLNWLFSQFIGYPIDRNFNPINVDLDLARNFIEKRAKFEDLKDLQERIEKKLKYFKENT